MGVMFLTRFILEVYSIKRKEMIDALLEKHHGEGMKRRVVLQYDAE